MFFKKSENTNILDSLNNIESYLKNEINFLPNNKFECTGFNKLVKDKLDVISSLLNKKNDEELMIYGELMLVCEKIQNGIMDDKIYHINTSNLKLNYIAKTLNILVESLKNDIRQIIDILGEYSNCNYLNKLNTSEVSNDFKFLFQGVNSLQETITEMLIENKSNGLTLNNSSNSLLENVDKLNLSSTQAAASLEETAASLEEVTSQIKTNTQKISEMANLSNKVILSTKEGKSLATRTTTSMGEINKQVSSINEAITVIDQIAFQTNILSLNAAVEAATAGEAGKGFAVVAGEVRNLATRSAEAAKEIKDLVESAKNKTLDGKNIADNMIEGYEQLSINISQTVNTIQDIEKSSKNQLTSIEQINESINIIDHQTQSNANVASEAHNIALVTDQISKLIVNNADAKEFNGKDNVKIKKV